MRKTIEKPKRRKWRGRTKLYALAALIIVSALIYWEQAALLYIVSTLMISALLLAVAFANLKTKDRQPSQAEPGETPES